MEVTFAQRVGRRDDIGCQNVVYWRMDRCLSSKEHLLLFQRTLVWVPAPKVAPNHCIFSSRWSAVLFRPPQASGIHAMHIHTCIHTYTYIHIKINKNLKRVVGLYKATNFVSGNLAFPKQSLTLTRYLHPLKASDLSSIQQAYLWQVTTYNKLCKSRLETSLPPRGGVLATAHLVSLEFI